MICYATKICNSQQKSNIMLIMVYIGHKCFIFVPKSYCIMNCQSEHENMFKEKELEDCLRDILLNQDETHELWEIDECVRLLFDLSGD